MHKVADWASFHSIDLNTVQDVLQARRAFALRGVPDGWTALAEDSQYAVGARDTTFRDLVIPAICDLLGREDMRAALAEVPFGALSDYDCDRPHVLDRGAGQKPLIAMDWQGTAADLVCLAHETAHAAQILLADGVQMPPMARETCAFLGELALIDAMRVRDGTGFAALCAVWAQENAAYLGSDLEALEQALKDPDDAPYDYRLNYPLARLAAVQLYVSGQGAAVFSAGAQAMEHLPLAAMARGADAIPNYLPALTVAERPTDAAYQSLGAMALLDIDTLTGESERDIESYYAGLLPHLQQQSAFIALRDDRKPIGYATWRKTSSDRVVLTHQTAPFGNHLALQRTLRQHLGADTAVSAQHARSARQEQVAW